MTDRLRGPLALPCGMTLPNRLLKSAMTEGLADPQGRPQQTHELLYRRWAEGGTGTLITGNVMVDGRYLERPGNVIVEDERHLPELERWVEAGTRGGTQLWMQINHPGRQCSRLVTREPVAPSAVQLRLGGFFARPRPLAVDEIVAIIGRFARTAGVARRAGFTGVQVHAAHGYLASQFLSPHVNRRTDGWGGSLENRARFVREVVRAVRREVGPSYPVTVKLNSSDFQKGGFTLDECAKVAAWLFEDGIDLLEISGGTYENPRLLGVGTHSDADSKIGDRAKAQSTLIREAYYLEYAAALRREVRVPLAVTGGFRSRAAMEEALAGGSVDMIGIARPLAVEPALAHPLLAGKLLELERDERRLTLGGGLLGPASPNATMRGLNSQAQIAWYYQQLLHLAADEPIEPELTAGAALWRHLRREWRIAAERRALGRTPLSLPREQSS